MKGLAKEHTAKPMDTDNNVPKAGGLDGGRQRGVRAGNGDICYSVN